jgi:hypothetical protein
MAEPQFLIKFDGGDAKQHASDMRLLGRSLIGFDRIISDGIVVVLNRRQPKRGERAHLIVKAKEPRAGSQDIWAMVQDISTQLPLGAAIVSDIGPEYIWRWVSFVLEWYAGRKKKANEHLEAILELQRINESGRAASEERFLAEIGKTREQLITLVEKLARPAAQAVALVGPSVGTVAFSSGSFEPTVVDVPMAETIRAKGLVELTDLQTLDLTLDGFSHHNRRLNVAHPSEPGRFIWADVRDPIFDTVPNVYTDAANRKATIRVEARLAYRDESLEKIYIMNFGGAKSAA